jgi:hypothetical protein
MISITILSSNAQIVSSQLATPQVEVAHQPTPSKKNYSII